MPGVKSGAGNYFCPRATLSLFGCLAGQIPVKKAIIKLTRPVLDRFHDSSKVNALGFML
jgi:hypothetical protein